MNMKIVIRGLVLAAALMLGACAGVPDSAPVSGSGVVIGGAVVPGDTTIQQIQDTAVRVCGFVPTVTTVTGIVASFFPGGGPINSIVSTVANGICNAVVSSSGKKTARRAGASGPPTVGGVRVEGYFTR